MAHPDDTSFYSIVDDAADTLRFARLDPDFGDTAILDVTSRRPRGVDRTAARRRLIRATRQDIARLRDALAAGWDVGPELAHEERRLAALESALQRRA